MKLSINKGHINARRRKIKKMKKHSAHLTLHKGASSSKNKARKRKRGKIPIKVKEDKVHKKYESSVRKVATK